MKLNRNIFILMLSLVAVAKSVQADEALAKSKGCLGCHAVDQKLLGPAYKDVAAKYAGKNALDQLSQKVMQGGSGVWGQIPMPANAVTTEEAQKMVKWILSLK